VLRHLIPGRRRAADPRALARPRAIASADPPPRLTHRISCCLG
jgi:hypothetical protein